MSTLLQLVHCNMAALLLAVYSLCSKSCFHAHRIPFPFDTSRLCNDVEHLVGSKCNAVEFAAVFCDKAHMLAVCGFAVRQNFLFAMALQTQVHNVVSKLISTGRSSKSLSSAITKGCCKAKISLGSFSVVLNLATVYDWLMVIFWMF